MIGAIIAKRMASAVLDTLNLRDLDTYMSNWAEDSTYIFPGNLPISGETRGKEAIRELHQKYLDKFPLINFTMKNVFIENIFALGATNVVAVEWDVKYKTHEGEEFENSGVSVVHVEKGKAVLIREYIFDVELDKRAWGE